MLRLVGYLLFSFISISIVAQTSGNDYGIMMGEARTCFERGRFEECDSLLAELSHQRLKLRQRRKVCQLMMDNSYYTGRQDVFLSALNSKYVKRNMDRSDYAHWTNLSKIPPIEETWPDSHVVLPLRMIGPKDNCLYGIDVSVNGKILLGMLDNCCSDYSHISTDLAGQLGIRPLGKTVNVNGNKQSKAYLGVLDSLSLGGLVIRNIVFQVSDFPEVLRKSYPFDLVIGNNVLFRVGDMIIDNEEGTINFSKETADLPQNVFWSYSAHDYYVKGLLNGKEVSMLLDFGNTNTFMKKRFHDRFPSDGTYAESSRTSIMMDRTLTSKTYVMKEARFEICNTVRELPDVNINLESYGSEARDGNLGVDMLRQFRTVLFNAGKLYLQLND